MSMLLTEVINQAERCGDFTGLAASILAKLLTVQALRCMCSCLCNGHRWAWVEHKEMTGPSEYASVISYRSVRSDLGLEGAHATPRNASIQYKLSLSSSNSTSFFRFSTVPGEQHNVSLIRFHLRTCPFRRRLGRSRPRDNCLHCSKLCSRQHANMGAKYPR